MKTTDTVTLFAKALNTVNQAIDANRETFPYNLILDASEELEEDKRFGAAVYKDDPQKPHDYFTVRFRDGRLEFVSHGKSDVNYEWRVADQYLEELAESPERFIESPSLVDLEWLNARLFL